MWISAFKNMDTGEKVYFLEGDEGWRELMDNATLIVGHNICSYDLPILKKLFNYTLPKHVKVQDTMIMSLVLNYNRFPFGQHSLENWGKFLGVHKGDFEDFSQYTEEMLQYCLTDLDVTEAIYTFLMTRELPAVAQKNPQIRTYLRVEHAVAKWSALATLHGWPFDVERATELFNTMEAEMKAAEAAIVPLLGMKAVAVDKKNGIVEEKKPKWTKDGNYAAHTANWFGIDPFLGQDPEGVDGLSEKEKKLFRPIVGPYCRVTFEKLKLSSTDDVKLFLFRNGWKPTEWNTKRDPETGALIKTSPKITEDDLAGLKGHGKLYADYCSTSSRFSILKTWLENVDSNGLLHGQCFTIGTPSMRARHSIIANIPSVDTKWGKEIRQLFGTLPGWSFIGADSSGNQARGLAHYLNSPEYTDLLLNGDVHTFNAEVATRVLSEMGISKTVDRSTAKRILYAFLFGASGKKLWSYIFGVQDQRKGNKFKKGFTKAVPGFEKLLKKLENIYGATTKYGDGYIYGIGGNKIFVDSFHKLLVYLLQACEKATCGAATMLTMEKLEAEGIPYIPLIMYHDEIDFMVPDEYAERAQQISKEAFREGPKLFGVQIMDGEAKIGRNWYECH